MKTIINQGETILSNKYLLNVAIAENTRNTAELNRETKEAIREQQEADRETDTTLAITNAELAIQDAIDATASMAALESQVESQENERQDYYNAYKFLEDYDNSHAYIVGNKVKYLNSTYQCILATTGNSPLDRSDNTWWKCIAARGIDGTGGDMMSSVYDATNKNTDIFEYVDDQIGDRSLLPTSNTDLVSAINEVNTGLEDIAINVKSFGVKGDGLTDDTLALQNVLNTYSNIFIPEGTYLIDNIDIQSNVKRFIGCGVKTIFKPFTTNLSGALFALYNTVDAVISGFKCEIDPVVHPNGFSIYSSNINRTILSHLTLYPTSLSGFNMQNMTYSTIENCVVYDWRSLGIFINGIPIGNKIINNCVEGSGNVHAVQSWGGYNNTIINNNIIGAGGFGINTYNEHHDIISNNEVKNTHLEGINIQNTSHTNILNNVITWDVDGSGADFGLSLYAPDDASELCEHNIISNNNISNCWSSGLALAENCSYNNICNNTINNPNKSNGVSGSGINLYGSGCQNNKIDGNYVSETDSTGNLKYGISEFSAFGTPNNNLIINNKVLNAIENFHTEGLLTKLSNNFPNEWINYTPPVTSITGTVTSYTITKASYNRQLDMCYISCTIKINTNGTASNAIVISLPFEEKGNAEGFFVGRENYSTGLMLQGSLSGSNTIFVRTFNNEHPSSDGAVIEIQGWYRTK